MSEPSILLQLARDWLMLLYPMCYSVATDELYSFEMLFVPGAQKVYCSDYTGCDRIRYTNLEIYCDQMNSNITTQFLTEHLTLQDFYKCSIWLPLVMRRTSRRYYNSSHSSSKKVTPIRAMALIRISYGCLPHNQWQPYRTLVKKIEVLTDVL
jgi:hypothetical protein